MEWEYLTVFHFSTALSTGKLLLAPLDTVTFHRIPNARLVYCWPSCLSLTPLLVGQSTTAAAQNYATTYAYSLYELRLFGGVGIQTDS